jgi:UDP-2,3-diacylglucosamine pyrophosphatase LpxH
MRRFLQRILTRPVTWLANRFSSRPNLERVHTALTKLYQHTQEEPGKKGIAFETTETNARFIIFSDQHKGAKNGSDDFMLAEPNYMAALNYYLKENFHFISLGDEEELWENTIRPVKAKNKESIALQNKFYQKNCYTKVFGNHDIFWNNDPFASLYLADMYDKNLKVYEAVLLKIKMADKKLTIFLAHGHQGDGQSDGNPFSAWFVGRIWAPLQTYLNLNPNVPATNNELKTAHNLFMYEWSKQENNPVLITGHTHQPVFASLTYLERLYRKLDIARTANDDTVIETLNKEIIFRQNEYDFVVGSYGHVKPCYFNSGCCCFVDGDITGIEIAEGMIRLIKWHKENEVPQRIVLEEMPLKDL